ncbi:MAG: ComEA family DNA-binding protein, partial [Chloroflexi bacterium]|nr:ComEA family DNA-binding protein [Chloroflexota bacterium]
MNKYMLVGFGVLVGLLAAGLLWITVSPPRGEPVTLLPTPTPELITIHVAGAVAAPGIYILPQDSRMVAAIEAAGGFLPTADSDQLNLAS